MTRTRHLNPRASKVTLRKNKRYQTALSNTKRVSAGYGMFEGEGKRKRKAVANSMRMMRRTTPVRGKVTKAKLQKRNTGVRQLAGYVHS